MLIKITIQGVSPLLCNRFTEADQQQVQTGTSSAISTKNGTPRDQATPKVYLGADGKPVLPGPNLFAAIVDAGRFIKAGKSKLTTQRSSIVPAGAAILEMDLPITPGKWEPDSRAVVNPATQGRRMCHRPRFDEWRVSFSLQVDETMFSAATARDLVDTAGQRVGVGDFRPSRKGPFGRFKVTHWKVEK